MIPHGPRRLGYYAGKNWFQSAVLFVVLGLFAIGLLSALNGAKEQAERQVVDLTIRNMRTGMQLAIGEALMRQRERDMASWVGSNPVQWLGTSPAGYRGECTTDESRDLSGGEWCFERTHRELVYRPRRIERLQALGEKNPRQCSQLRWRVARTPGNEDSGGFIGLRLEAASSCRWVVEVN